MKNHCSRDFLKETVFLYDNCAHKNSHSMISKWEEKMYCMISQWKYQVQVMMKLEQNAIVRHCWWHDTVSIEFSFWFCDHVIRRSCQQYYRNNNNNKKSTHKMNILHLSFQIIFTELEFFHAVSILVETQKCSSLNVI